MRSCRNSVLFNKRLSISQKNHNFNELTSTHRISIAPNKTLYMNPENPLHALVAISLMPKLNSGLYYPLIQKCSKRSYSLTQQNLYSFASVDQFISVDESLLIKRVLSSAFFTTWQTHKSIAFLLFLPL